LVSTLRVSLYFAQACVARDRGNFVHGASCFCEAAGSGLTQSMSRAVGQGGCITVVAEPVAEPGRSKRLPGLRRQERQVLGPRFGNDRGKC
jgi:hypothetical protein